MKRLIAYCFALALLTTCATAQAAFLDGDLVVCAFSTGTCSTSAAVVGPGPEFVITDPVLGHRFVIDMSGRTISLVLGGEPPTVVQPRGTLTLADLDVIEPPGLVLSGAVHNFITDTGVFEFSPANIAVFTEALAVTFDQSQWFPFSDASFDLGLMAVSVPSSAALIGIALVALAIISSKSRRRMLSAYRKGPAQVRQLYRRRRSASAEAADNDHGGSLSALAH